MSAMPPKKLLSMWLNEKIPSERTMGQVLQHLVQQEERAEKVLTAVAEIQLILKRLSLELGLEEDDLYPPTELGVPMK